MASFATQMVAALRAALATGANVVSTQVDGVAITFNRDQALKELTFWERKEARETGSRPTAARIRLDHG